MGNYATTIITIVISIVALVVSIVSLRRQMPRVKIRCESAYYGATKRDKLDHLAKVKFVIINDSSIPVTITDISLKTYKPNCRLFRLAKHRTYCKSMISKDELSEHHETEVYDYYKNADSMPYVERKKIRGIRKLFFFSLALGKELPQEDMEYRFTSSRDFAKDQDLFRARAMWGRRYLERLAVGIAANRVGYDYYSGEIKVAIPAASDNCRYVVHIDDDNSDQIDLLPMTVEPYKDKKVVAFFEVFPPRFDIFSLKPIKADLRITCAHYVFTKKVDIVDVKKSLGFVLVPEEVYEIMDRKAQEERLWAFDREFSAYIRQRRED